MMMILIFSHDARIYKKEISNINYDKEYSCSLE